MRRTWRLLVPACAVYLCVCLAIPVGAGVFMREKLGGEPVGVLFQSPSSSAWLGVRLQDLTSDLSRSLGLRDSKGVVVVRVFPKSPASDAGLTIGDVITAINGNPIADKDAAGAVLDKVHPSEIVKLLIVRSGPGGPDSKSIELKSVPQPKTGQVAKWETFQKQGVPFQINYPDLWAVDDDRAPRAPVVFSPPTAFDDVVQIRVAEGAPPLDDWYKQVMDANKDSRGLKILSEQQISLGGQPAKRVSLTYTSESNEQQNVTLVLIRGSGPRGYFLLLSTDPSTYNDLSRVFDQMLATFSPKN